MNIRHLHSKFSLLDRVEQDERYAIGTRDGSKVALHDATHKNKTTEFSTTLAALVNTEPSQIAGVMNAIADELRAAADLSAGSQSGFLDALADRFETAATTAKAANTSETANTTELSEDNAVPLPVLPSRGDQDGQRGIFGVNQSARLLDKILDAVNDALAKVALVPNSTKEADTTSAEPEGEAAAKGGDA